MVSDDGRFGATVIALLGSVFSPFYARERALRPDADPLRHCAINVAIYGRGAEAWALTERQSSSLERRPEGLSLAGSRIGWEGDALVVRFDERTAPFAAGVRAGRRLSGTVRLHPRLEPAPPVLLSAHGEHRWWPVAPAAHAEVELDEPALRFSGSGYADANAGAGPLEDAFSGWTWCRAPLSGGRALVQYDVEPRDGPPRNHAWLFRAGAAPEPVELPQRRALARTAWGLSRSVRADGEARVKATLEDTPFYARSLVELGLAGERALGVHEALSLTRFSSAWVRFLLPFRMRRAA